MKTAYQIWLSVSVWIPLLAGCGVVTVDVDVYKGPLANHIDVQRETAAVTALASKPLLGKLRYELESFYRYRTFGGNCGDKELEQLRLSDEWLPADASDANDCGPQSFAFHSWQAAFVNRILAEFNDQSENRQLQQLKIQLDGSKTCTLEPIASLAMTRARGRPGRGLETLTYLYLIKKQQLEKPQDGSLPPHRFFQEEVDLFDALVHFSQKVLFVANQDILFREKRGIPQTLSKGISTFFNGGTDPNAIRNSYVSVLQSIGNSILVNLDELREQAQHEQDLRGQAASREAAAVLAAASPDPWQSLHNLMLKLQVQLEDDEKQLSALRQSTHGASASPGGAAASSDNSTTPSTTPAGNEPATQPTSKPQSKPATSPATQPGESTAEQIKKLESKKKCLTEVIKRLREEIGGVLAESAASTRPASGAAVVDRLIGILTQKRAALPADEKSKADAQILDEVIWELQTIQAPAHIDAALAGATDAKGVLDGVITVLRQQLITAIQTEGKDSPHVKNLQDAINTAELQRQDMIYIRPASSYLRTSFPASSLQRDARLGFRNLLAEHMSHQVPFADAFANGRDYRTLLELDKQYWQNINTVRVVGGGNINYVIAKDDIGNWYVKDYSADPKDIIKSAQGLALFAAGPSLGVGNDLIAAAAKQTAAAKIASGDPQQAQEAKQIVDQAKAAQDTGSKTNNTSGSGSTTGSSSPATSGTNTSLLSSELKDASDTYKNNSDTDLKNVQDQITKLPDSIKTAWQADPVVKGSVDQLSQTLADVAKTYLPAAKSQTSASSTPPTPATPAPAASNTPAGQQIIDDLQSMRRFHNALVEAVREKLTPAPTAAEGAANPGAPTPQQVIDAANRVATRVIRDAIQPALKKRQKTVGDYQVALDLIDKAAGQ